VIPACRKKVCFVVSEPITVRAFLIDQLRALSERYDLTLATNTKDERFLTALGISGRVISVPLERAISPKQDLAAIVKLWWLFRTEKFDSIHSVTPKAGLLAALAGAFAWVPNRLHTFTGQVWVTRTGIMRSVLRLADKVIATMDTHLLADSLSQREFLISEKVLRAEKCSVLGKGSISGVDLSRFHPDLKARVRLRQVSGIPPDALVFLFIGRLTRDKGVHDLARAFGEVVARIPNAYLWIVGPDEQGIAEEVIQMSSGYSDRVMFFGSSSTPEQFMAAADVLSLPSYREGFGSVAIEAAAVGIPAIVSRIYGLTDAVQDGVTGVFHTARNVEEITDRMVGIARDPALRCRLGENARRRAHEDFSKDVLTSALIEFYSRLFSGGLRGRQRGWRGGVKRAMDVLCAGAMLVLASPALAVVALLIRLTLGKPVLFRQIRPGRHEQPFTLIKFRTMSDRRDLDGKMLPDAGRLTRIGRLLRATSLDELPQLWNVLRGDISLVGPRPLLMEYLPRYSPEQARRHDVMPGITGWAQVNGRNGIDWEKKFEHDVWYVDHWSLWLDIRILTMTIWKVLCRQGISSANQATMPEFKGSRHSASEIEFVPIPSESQREYK
jgi:lipopolysaccharide/colanic/teichoic acid biosynthesis glycosyltransferase/glycosyltransferase involved in cell wall biosynthesis